MNVKQGVITQPNATTGIQSITGLGFTPKLIFFFSEGTTSLDADNVSNIYSSYGVGNNALEQFVGSFHRPDNTSGARNGVGMDDSKVIKFIDNASTPNTLAAAELDSVNSDGFDLDWTTCDSTQRRIAYIAFGGSDLTNTKIGILTLNNSTGAQAITGVGFKPDLVGLIQGRISSTVPSVAREGGGLRLGFGTNAIFDNFNRSDGDSLGSNWTEVSGDMDIASNKFSSANSGYALWTGEWPGAGANYFMEAVANLGGSVGGVHMIARYVDSSNYYYVHLNTFSQTIYLRKKVAGSDTDLGTFNGGYSNGNNYRVRFELNGTSLKVFVDGTQRISVTDSTFTARGQVGLGADSGSKTWDDFWVYSQFAFSGWSYSGDNPTSTRETYKRLKILTIHDNSVFGESALQSLDSDGFTLNHNDAHDSKVGYVALKGLKVGMQWINERGSSGSQATTGMGFTPEALMLFAYLDPARETSVTSNHLLSIGLTDGTNTAALTHNSGTAQSGTSREKAWFDDDDIYRSGIFFSSPLVVVELTSLDTDGFTFNYTTATDSAREVQILAFASGTPGTEDASDERDFEIRGSDAVDSERGFEITGEAEEAQADSERGFEVRGEDYIPHKFINEPMAIPPRRGTLANNATFIPGYLRLTEAVNDQRGYFYFNEIFPDFIQTNFDIWAGGGNGADAMWFFFGGDGYFFHDEQGQDTNCYLISFDEYGGDLGGNTIQILFDGTLLTYVTVPFDFDDSTWRTARVRIRRGATQTRITVYIDGTIYLDFTENNRTLAGNYFGWGARTGGLNNEHRIRNILFLTDREERNFELTGSVTEEDDRDFETRGLDTADSERGFELTGFEFFDDDSERDFEIRGVDTDDSERNFEVRGTNDADSERDFETRGSNTASSERGFEIHGIATDNNDRDFEVRGVDSANDSRGFEVQAIGDITSERNFEIRGQNGASSERGFELVGFLRPNSVRAFEIRGTNDITSQRGFEVVGQGASSDTRAFEVPAIGTLNNDRGFELRGTNDETNDRNFEVRGLAGQSSVRDFETRGTDNADSERGFELVGSVDIQSQRGFEVRGLNSDTSDRNFETRGLNTASNTRSFEIRGIATDESDRSFEIVGSVTVDSERGFSLFGVELANSERGFELTGKIKPNSERNFEVRGYYPPVKRVSVSIRKLGINVEVRKVEVNVEIVKLNPTVEIEKL